MTRRRTALLAGPALLALLLAGCGDEDATPDAPASPSTPAASASATATTPPSASPTPSASPGAEPATPFSGSLDDSAQDPAGGALTVVAARVAAQDGYDRVVLELDGAADGEPGWQVGYVDAPSSQGSGEPVDVAGDAFLSVYVTGVGLPSDTGVDELVNERRDGADTAGIAEVIVGAQFEGMYEVFVGLDGEPRPFRVTRLSDPARLVVDVQAP